MKNIFAANEQDKKDSTFFAQSGAQDLSEQDLTTISGGFHRFDCDDYGWGYGGGWRDGRRRYRGYGYGYGYDGDCGW